MKKTVKIVLPILLGVLIAVVLLGSLAAFFGMADQYFDFRHLRRSPEDDNHDDDEQEDDF